MGVVALQVPWLRPFSDGYAELRPFLCCDGFEVGPFACCGEWPREDSVPFCGRQYVSFEEVAARQLWGSGSASVIVL